MLAHSARLAALIATAFALSGCFLSDYDISTQIKPETPLATGAYRTDKGEVKNVTLSGGTYTAMEPAAPARAGVPAPRGPERTHLRLYRVPEFENYIVQLWIEPEAGKKLAYTYLFADVTGRKITFLGCPYENLPAYLQNLVHRRDQGADVTVTDGARDTLYLVREVGRRDTKLEAAESYTRE